MEICILGVAPGSGFFKHIFCGFLKKINRANGYIFSKHIFACFIEEWDPGIFQKSQIFKISCSSHSKNAHIKLNGFQSIFGGWGDMPFIFFMGRMGQKSENGHPRRAVYPPGVGQ